MILSGSILQAQSIKGNVSDSGGPIPLVNIVVNGTNINTTTDFDGNFVLTKVNPSDVIVFSYVGYQTQEIAVKNQTDLKVIMVATQNALNEVVIVGYTSQRRASITGAVSQVNLSELTKTKVPDASQALQGLVAGVFVAANTGAPGDGVKVRIRGEGTLGVNDVLYIIDGVPTRDIAFLNSADIATMTVLKDAASAAIYGSRSSNGVIVITTKSGKKGASSFDVDYYSGIHYAANLPKMLNSDQYLTVKDQAWHNTAGNAADAVSPYFADRTRTDLADTNWQKELFETGLSQNFQVSTSGASDNVNYLISGGYYGIDGIIVEDNDQYSRINFRTNVDANLSERFKIGTNIQMSYEQQDKLSSSGDAPGIIRHALLRPPVISVYKDVNDPTYSTADPYTDLPFYTGPDHGWSEIYEKTSNPLAIVHFTSDVRQNFKAFGNVYGEYGFLADKSLKFKSSLGVDINFNHNKNFNENYGDKNLTDITDPNYGLGRNNRPNGLDENRGQYMTFTFSNTLNYVKTINEKHSINALLGVESINYNEAAIGGSRQRYDNISDAFRYLDYGGTAENEIWNSGSSNSWALLSYFASGTYGYDNKYFASATIRADASSRFGPNNKWGYFPSVSGGWVISKEDFMKEATWLTNLKVRASWGQGGNQEIPNNAYETLVSESGGIVNIVRYGNPDLKWETTTQTDFGVDMAIFNDKLSFSADYFIKKTTDILLSVALPVVSVGLIDRTYVNAGEVTNQGFELGVNYKNYDHAFKYSINANVATLTNNVNALQTYVKDITDASTYTRTTVGQPISSYFGYVSDGIYQNTAEINNTLYLNSNGAQPGDMKFKDLNGDGQINADDRTFIGTSIPQVTYGLSFNAEYKNFDISFLFQGVENVDRYNDLKKILNYDSRPFNSMTSVLDAWHGEGTSNSIPRNTFNDNGGGQVSSTFVEDASYLRLKNIEIGYTFPKTFAGIKYLRMYVSGHNLLTFTKYTGLDPESTSLIDMGTYPQANAFLFGLKVKL